VLPVPFAYVPAEHAYIIKSGVRVCLCFCVCLDSVVAVVRALVDFFTVQVIVPVEAAMLPSAHKRQESEPAPE